MEAGQELQENTQYEEAYLDEAYDESSTEKQETEQQEEYATTEEETNQRQESKKQGLIYKLLSNNQSEDKSSFIHGLSVGLGIGCLATFIIMWIAVFFTPQLPSTVTYEAMLSVFIYPLVYLLAVGLIALTAGIVREYYTRKSGF